MKTMENKIVYMKTYIITICLLILLFLVGIGGCVFYYEKKIDELENTINTYQNQYTITSPNGGITILPGGDTSVSNVTAE